MDVKAIPVSLRSVVPTSNGTAVFLACEQKTFVIYIDPAVGSTLSMAINGERKERPLTHDLMGNVFSGFGIKLDRVVINHVEEGVYFARLILVMQNEIGTKILEVDARPSDALVMAVQLKRPVYVTNDVLARVEDMTEVLEKILKPKS
ncbi:MAG: bifunctional nuclease family protein [Puniceicoccales bacterium]|nr:bifunctional nuclease family protein [Puniceicoccales bacterium]